MADTAPSARLRTSRRLHTCIVSAMALCLLAVPAAPATAGHPVVTEVEGLAYNYYSDVSLFGGPLMRRGYLQDEFAAQRGQTAPPASAASPSIACPAGGGSDSVTDPDGAIAEYGPAVIFGGIWPEGVSSAPPSGPLTSAIDCELGAGGHATASTALRLMPAGSSYPGGVGPGPFIADEVDSSCTKSPDGITSTVTIVDGILETQYDPDTGEATQTEAVPTNPVPNYTRQGTLDHVGDSYEIVFNEQVENPDGSFTVNAAHLYLLGPTAVGDLVIGSSTCGPLTTTQPEHDAPVADFTGDGSTDFSFSRPGTGWFVHGVAGSTPYGIAGDVPVPADFTGDGATDFAIYRPSNGRWFVYGITGSTRYGLSSDVPVPADYTGDDTTDVAIYRPGNGRWFVHGVSGSTQLGGVAGDVAVPGDYDGDGTTDFAVYRPGSGRWYVDGVAGSTAYGISGDVPVPGDYDGDGATDFAVYRPGNGRWFVHGIVGSTRYGLSSDQPMPGDYDGDGVSDVAIYRPSNGRWFVHGVTGSTQYGGQAGDRALPLPHAIHQPSYGAP